MNGGRAVLNEDLLTGRLVHLAALDPERDARLRVQWFGNSAFARLSDSSVFPRLSSKTVRAQMEKNITSLLAYEFVIETLTEQRNIGFVGLDGDGINSPHRDAFVGISIGPEELWGKGYGTDAMEIILRYAFTELNLHRVSLNVFAYNTRAIRSYEKCGFRVEGRERSRLHRDGQRFDVIYMGLLRAEWLARAA
jgi:RimJ/RimL family protein N-acetyltransferase